MSSCVKETTFFFKIKYHKLQDCSIASVCIPRERIKELPIIAYERPPRVFLWLFLTNILLSWWIQVGFKVTEIVFTIDFFMGIIENYEAMIMSSSNIIAQNNCRINTMSKSNLRITRFIWINILLCFTYSRCGIGL